MVLLSRLLGLNVIFICLASVYLRDGQVPATLVVLLLLILLKRLLEETWQLRRLCPRRIAAEGDAASRWNCHAFFVFLAVNLSFHAFLDWVYLAISGCALYFLWSFEPYPLRRSLIALYFYCAWLSALYWLRGIRAWRFNEKSFWPCETRAPFSWWWPSLCWPPSMATSSSASHACLGVCIELLRRPSVWPSWVTLTFMNWNMWIPSSLKVMVPWSLKTQIPLPTTPSSTCSSMWWP